MRSWFNCLFFTVALLLAVNAISETSFAYTAGASISGSKCSTVVTCNFGNHWYECKDAIRSITATYGGQTMTTSYSDPGYGRSGGIYNAKPSYTFSNKGNGVGTCTFQIRNENMDFLGFCRDGGITSAVRSASNSNLAAQCCSNSDCSAGETCLNSVCIQPRKPDCFWQNAGSCSCSGQQSQVEVCDGRATSRTRTTPCTPSCPPSPTCTPGSWSSCSCSGQQSMTDSCGRTYAQSCTPPSSCNPSTPSGSSGYCEFRNDVSYCSGSNVHEESGLSGSQCHAKCSSIFGGFRGAGCWVLAWNGICYCRDGNIGTGSARPGGTCPARQSTCPNGVCSSGESCPQDDSACLRGYYCTSGCQPRCGDGVCTSGENCALDSVGCSSGSACTSGCQAIPDTTPPNVVLTASQVCGSVETPITFDASSSGDNRDNDLEFSWDFDNNGIFEIGLLKKTLGGGVNARTFSTPGTHVVSVKARDDAGNEGRGSITITASPCSGAACLSVLSQQKDVFAPTSREAIYTVTVANSDLCQAAQGAKSVRLSVSNINDYKVGEASKYGTWDIKFKESESNTGESILISLGSNEQKNIIFGVTPPRTAPPSQDVGPYIFKIAVAQA